nr:D-glycero-beta-D-manno-heptose 1,7-bisphosphate 7-phosphatase [Sneathiella limimaris]
MVILDRDGVINEDRTDFVKTPDELVFIDGALSAISRLNKAGHTVVIATNQSCIGRGIITTDTLTIIHQKLTKSLKAAGGWVDQIFFAPDAPWEATNMRKPGDGMMKAALNQFGAKPSNTVVIGDSLRDLQAAASSGCHRCLVQTGKGVKTQKEGLPRDILPVAVAASLSEAVDFIEAGRFQ